MSAVEYLTVDETATLLRVDRKTVYAEIHSGRLPGIKIRGQFRVNRLGIDAQLAYEPREPGTTVMPFKPRRPAGEFSRRACGVDSASDHELRSNP